MTSPADANRAGPPRRPVLPEDEIARLLRVPKRLDRWRPFRSKRPPWDEWKVNLTAGGVPGGFTLACTRRTDTRHDWAIVLVYTDRQGHSYRLLRVEEKDNQHMNTIEKGSVADRFRINRATERYQWHGLPEDGFAASGVGRFTDRLSALAYLATEANIALPPGAPP